MVILGHQHSFYHTLIEINIPRQAKLIVNQYLDCGIFGKMNLEISSPYADLDNNKKKLKM